MCSVTKQPTDQHVSPKQVLEESTGGVNHNPVTDVWMIPNPSQTPACCTHTDTVCPPNKPSPLLSSQTPSALACIEKI